jgi:hypothetical protein
VNRRQSEVKVTIVEELEDLTVGEIENSGSSGGDHDNVERGQDDTCGESIDDIFGAAIVEQQSQPTGICIVLLFSLI